MTLDRTSDTVRLRYIIPTPAAKASPPQVYQREINALTPEQVKQPLSAARGDRLEAAYVLPSTLVLFPVFFSR